MHARDSEAGETDVELVLASNRLPIKVTLEEGQVTFEDTVGGLASALRGLGVERRWVGWPGAEIPIEHQPDAADELRADGFDPVFLDSVETDEYYNRVCNETLWPLLHTFPDRIRSPEEAWDTYVRVNDRFADAIALAAPPNGRVWIHDFHLMLVPDLLRKRRPDVSIGFFLHVPFPPFEVFRILPARRVVLLSLLQADYTAFHTSAYAAHFVDACANLLGVELESGEPHPRFPVEVGVDPIGIDVSGFDEALASPRAHAAAQELEERYGRRRLVLGVERLDYTKGVRHKLRSFEAFLEADPDRALTTTLLQVIVPSRLESDDYQTLKNEIEGEVARINGRFARPGVTPVEYMHTALGRPELSALYRRADVMLVTPLRDGMNLVAQEFVECQVADGPGDGERGVLVLSELAGASEVLSGAIAVNPWDTLGAANAIGEALALARDERARRLHRMAAEVRELDAHRWALRFIERLDRKTRSASR